MQIVIGFGIVVIAGIISYVVKTKFNKDLKKIINRVETNKWIDEWLKEAKEKNDPIICEETIQALKESFEEILKIPFSKFRIDDSLLYAIDELEMDKIAQRYFEKNNINIKINENDIDYLDETVGDICNSIFDYHAKLKK